MPPRRRLRDLLRQPAAAVAACCTVAVPLPARGGDELERLGLFTGCWRATQGDTIIEELWLPPAGGVLLGLSRTVDSGELELFEFLRLEQRDGRWHYVAQPNGVPPTWFALTSLSDDEAVFEDPSHDFPQKIRYRRLGADALQAEISGPGDDGKEQKFTFDYRRAPCPDAGGVRPRE